MSSSRNNAGWRRISLRVGILALVMGLVSGCKPPEKDFVQGYVEGDFVYVASPRAGALETLSVERGTSVNPGDPLFALESGEETAARDLAVSRLAEGKARLDDAMKGKRPEEIDAIAAQLDQAKTALDLSAKEFARQTMLQSSGATSAQELDRARTARDRDRQRVSQLEADLQTAKLGARSDQIKAAQENVKALEAALAKAEWDLGQKRQNAAQAGVVFDTLYRAGEWVAAGRPVVVLLPPGNVKVRAFVSETKVGAIHPGDPVRVSVDGVPEAFAGKVSFVSPKVEYTPPVIYSRESRAKLVFMVETVFDAASAAKLHPGQPVDVRFTP